MNQRIRWRQTTLAYTVVPLPAGELDVREVCLARQRGELFSLDIPFYRTPPYRATATADAALVTPAHVLPEVKASTGTVLTEYQTWPRLRPKGEQP